MTTNTPQPPDSEEESTASPWIKRSAIFIAAILIVGILVIGGNFVLHLFTNNASPAAGEEQTEQTATTDDDEEVVAVDDEGRCPDPTAPDNGSWEWSTVTYHGVADGTGVTIPQNPGVGPLLPVQTPDPADMIGVSQCFAKGERGAIFAAYNFMAWMNMQSILPDVFATLTVPGEMQDFAIEDITNTCEEVRGSCQDQPNVLTPRGYKIDQISDTRMVVTYAASPANDLWQVAATSLSLVWDEEANTWLIEIPPNLDFSFQPVASLASENFNVWGPQ